jgi:hypothetical protein
VAAVLRLAIPLYAHMMPSNGLELLQFVVIIDHEMLLENIILCLGIYNILSPAAVKKSSQKELKTIYTVKSA